MWARRLITTLFFFLLFSCVWVRPAWAQVDWPMPGANQERTGWVSDGPTGQLEGVWAKPFEPQIAQRTQLIAAENKIFVSTSHGLYAVDANTGGDAWVYSTDMPLGHSPAYDNGSLYVAGFDRKIHKINASNGAGQWVFTASGGFSVSPLVIGGKVMAGSRDGVFYAVNANNGSLAWSRNIGSPINQTAAYDQASQSVIFGAQDGYAYALRVSDGSIRWKSPEQIPGLGFHAYWPVIYENYVLFTKNIDFRTGLTPSSQNSMHSLEKDVVISETDGQLPGVRGTHSGPWVSGTPTLDIRTNPISGRQSIPSYLESNPGRRNLIILNLNNGSEKTFDINNNGTPDYAPMLWNFTGSGAMPPPVVGSDGVLYFRSTVMSDGGIASGPIVGWDFGTSILSLPMSRTRGQSGDWPVDEPIGVSSGGNIIYTNLCCDRRIDRFDISVPNHKPIPNMLDIGDKGRQFRFENIAPSNYNSELSKLTFHPFQTKADVAPPPSSGDYDVRLYYAHGVNNGPVPYDGKLYVHRSNAVIALGSGGGSGLKNTAAYPSSPPNNHNARNKDHLVNLLEAEIQKMLDVYNANQGSNRRFLKPGYNGFHGLANFRMNSVYSGVWNYFDNPGDTIYVLMRAYSQVQNQTLKSQLKTYIKDFFKTYPPYEKKTRGWGNGTTREGFLMDQNDVLNRMSSGPSNGMEPRSFYALWLYANEFKGDSDVNPQTIFNAAKGKLGSPPSNSDLAWQPHIHNAYIAGYQGYVNLQQLAEGSADQSKRNTLSSLLSTRASNFTGELRYGKDRNSSIVEALKDRFYYVNLIGWNFMYMVPELQEYLRDNALSKVQTAVDQYNTMHPQWFMALNDDTQGEGVFNPLYHYHGMFQAKAGILKEGYTELEKFLDISAYARGDLFYIDNLVAALGAPGEGGPNPTTPPTLPQSTEVPPLYLGDLDNDEDVDGDDYDILIGNLGGVGGVADINGDGNVGIFDYNILVQYFGYPNTGGTLPTATPTPPVSATGSLYGSYAHAVNPNTSDFDATYNALANQALTGLNGQLAKFTIVINNVAWGTDPLVNQIKNVFYPGMGTPPIGGASTANVNYNSISNDQFVPQGNSSTGIYAVGGESIEEIFMSRGGVGTYGNDNPLMLQTGHDMANELLNDDPNLLQNQAGKSYLLHLFGPMHNPAHKIVLCALKEVFSGHFTGSNSACDVSNVNFEDAWTPETGPQANYQIPNHINIIGSGSAHNGGNSIQWGTRYSHEVTSLLIKGNFNIALGGQAGGPDGDIGTKIAELTGELGGTPDILFVAPGHPGNYQTVRNEAMAALGGEDTSTTIIGHEGASEIGQFTTNSQPTAEIFTFFLAGLKGN